jgi:ADP-ribose pyrophosphatase
MSETLKNHPAYPPRGPPNLPVSFTHQAVIDNDRTKKQNGWADPAEYTPELMREIAKRTSFLGPIKFDLISNLPVQNEKTGIVGRGLLGKYGPNHAADPLVTYTDAETGEKYMVVITRETGECAIPGGMVDDGEIVSQTILREFREETQNKKDLDPELKIKIESMIEELFKGGKVVYQGIVDDPRNTDNAWIETTCVHFEIKDPWLFKNLPLQGDGYETKHARWLRISDDEVDFRGLYANHREFVVKAGLI